MLEKLKVKWVPFWAPADSMMTGGSGVEDEKPAESDASEDPPSDDASGDPPSGDELLAGKYKSADDLAKAYKELEGKLGMKEEDLRKVIEEDFTKEKYGSRPESPGDYQLPDVIDPEQATGNEMLDWWSKTAWEQGLGQEGFEEGIRRFAEHTAANAPDLDAEEAKLGENASQRLDAASAWARKQAGDDESKLAAFETLFMTAAGVEIVEGMMESQKSGTVGNDSSSGSQISVEKLREMQQDPRYHSPSQRDPAFVKMVDEGYQKLYGGNR